MGTEYLETFRTPSSQPYSCNYCTHIRWAFTWHVMLLQFEVGQLCRLHSRECSEFNKFIIINI